MSYLTKTEYEKLTSRNSVEEIVILRYMKGGDRLDEEALNILDVPDNFLRLKQEEDDIHTAGFVKSIGGDVDTVVFSKLKLWRDVQKLEKRLKDRNVLFLVLETVYDIDSDEELYRESCCEINIYHDECPANIYDTKNSYEVYKTGFLVKEFKRIDSPVWVHATTSESPYCNQCGTFITDEHHTCDPVPVDSTVKPLKYAIRNYQLWKGSRYVEEVKKYIEYL